MPFKHTRWLLAAACLFGIIPCQAQDSLTLQQCITFAWQNNITVMQAQNSMALQKSNYDRTRASALPSLNGTANQNYNFGRTIDPATNQFANQQNRTNYLSLQSDVVLFAGLQRINSIREAKWAQDASEQNIEKTRQDIALSVANMYLQILLLRERERQVQNQVENSREANKKSQILYNAGAITKAKSMETEAQLATDEANLVDIQNQLLKANLNLKQYINYDIAKPVEVASVNLEPGNENYTDVDLTKAVAERLSQLPGVKYADFSRESALYAYKAAKGAYYPRLAASGSIHSVYSSLTKEVTYVVNGYQPIGITGADSSLVYGPKASPVFNAVTFNSQLKNNFGQSLGFGLTIPIFNGLQTSYNVQNAKINLRNAELNLSDARNRAKNDIYQAYEGMKMAEKKYKAAQTKLQAQQSLFKQTDIGYQAGAVSYFDYNAQRILSDNAQIDALQAKYEFIFQTKIFEYYLGKPVQF